MQKEIKETNVYEEIIEFPSLYWGLIFYLSEKDYRKTLSSIRKFPSPYWGLFFQYEDTHNTFWLDKKFPSSYWGLIFYYT